MGECSGRCVRVFHDQRQALSILWHFFKTERWNLVFAETCVSIGNGGAIFESWTVDSHVILLCTSHARWSCAICLCGMQKCQCSSLAVCIRAVSYTHLTLPTSD